MSDTIVVAALYQFVALPDYQALREPLLQTLLDAGVKGTLLLAEPMSGTPGAEPIGDAYFGVYLLAMGSGRPRTSTELTTMLEAAGFARVRECRTRRPMLVRLLVAKAPEGPSAAKV